MEHSDATRYCSGHGRKAVLPQAGSWPTCCQAHARMAFPSTGPKILPGEEPAVDPPGWQRSLRHRTHGHELPRPVIFGKTKVARAPVATLVECPPVVVGKVHIVHAQAKAVRDGKAEEKRQQIVPKALTRSFEHQHSRTRGST